MKVKCNKCGFIGVPSDFKHGHDFFQNDYIAGCPKCDNRQTPGGASMRGFGGDRPFEYLRSECVGNVVDVVLHRASEAS